jgi:hypothetical protein
MAMEINSKNLHKHAAPLLILAALVLVVSAISLSQYQAPVSRSLEALFGQNQQQTTSPDLTNLGSTANTLINN